VVMSSYGVGLRVCGLGLAFITGCLAMLFIAAVAVDYDCHHPLHGVDSVHLQILLMGTC